VRSETFKVTLLGTQVLWDVTLCSWTSSSPYFGLHLERQAVHEAWRWKILYFDDHASRHNSC